jgi:hypothetical protein
MSSTAAVRKAVPVILKKRLQPAVEKYIRSEVGAQEGFIARERAMGRELQRVHAMVERFLLRFEDAEGRPMTVKEAQGEDGEAIEFAYEVDLGWRDEQS